MTISEKITRAKTDYDEVYGAGYEKGKSEGGDNETAYNEGFEAGKKSQYDEFWDNFQKNGTRTVYTEAFRQSTFEYIRPKYKIRPAQSEGSLNIFRQCNQLKKIEADYVDFSQIPYGTYSTAALAYTFTECYALEEIEDVGFPPCYMYNTTFSWCTRLHTIAKITVDENTRFTNTFLRCDKLKNLTMAGTIGQNGFDVKDSSELSKVSITSIINALSSTTSGLSITLSKAAVDKAWGTNNNGTLTFEWAQLIGTKPNWTISLV